MRETTIETDRVRGIACGWPSITAFYGIPYAAPPVGELRWRPPRPAGSWSGVRDCARPGPRCPQMGVSKGSFYEREFYPVEGPMDEDCLYLNVWTPAQSVNEKLPVIFWVHSGAFMTGYGHSAHFDGEPFARQRAGNQYNDERNIAMKMRKVLALVLTAALTLSLASCLNQAPASNGGTSTPNNSSASQSGGSGAPAANPDGAPVTFSELYIALHGTSAGANLCAALALYVRDHGGPDLSLMVLNCPVLSMKNTFSKRQYPQFALGAPVKREGVECIYLGGFDGSVPSYYAFPNYCTDLEGLPPHYIVVGCAWESPISAGPSPFSPSSPSSSGSTPTST